jgi:hypothetical protein
MIRVLCFFNHLGIEMKLRNVLIGCSLLTASSAALAAADTGVIVEVYVHLNGSTAILLDKGVPDAHAVNKCGYTGTELTQWAGVSADASSDIKSAILAAKATGSTVTLVTLGNCLGQWQQIEAMHIK